MTLRLLQHRADDGSRSVIAADGAGAAFVPGAASVRELAALEREVHGHVHVAGRDAGQEEQRVGVRVGGVGGHPGAGRQAGVLEAAGHAVRSVAELGVGPVAVLEAQGDGLRGAGDRACEHAADRVLRGGGGVGGCSTSPNAGPAGPGGPSADIAGFHVCVPVRGSNTIQITPMSLSPRGGLLVNLQGAPKPVSFLLISGQTRYDADLSVHVSSRGPNARIQIDTRPNAPTTGAPFLTAMLSGIAPADAVPLSVSGVSPDDVRAWRLGNQIYLRTRHTLMSPPWSASESGEGDVRIYALPSTPVVLLSVNGRTVSALLKE